MTRQQYISLALLTLGVMAVLACALLFLSYALFSDKEVAQVLETAGQLPQTLTPADEETGTLSPTTQIPPSATAPVIPTLLPSFTPIPPSLTQAVVPPTDFPSPLPPDPWIEATLARLTLADKVGQMIMMGVYGQSITSYDCQVVIDVAPGSIVYVGDNVVSPDQLRLLSASLQDCAASTTSAIPMWMALDHEGQYVTRFESGATVFPAALAIGATGNPENARLAALASASELAYSGVNMVLGPVADVLTNYENTVISQRSYGGNASLVSQFVAAAVTGYRQGGLVPVLKHYPGHGGVATDSHVALPVDFADIFGLQSNYLPPFQAGISANTPVVMFSHVAFPNIDPSGVPASLSTVMSSLLRDQMGFQGVILTDALGMGAISGATSVPEASVQAVLAGADMLLITSPEIAVQTRDRLVTAVQNGEIPLALVDASVRRILAVKSAWGQTGFPLPQPGSPAWSDNASLAYQIGYQAVSAIHDDAGLLPLPGSRVLLIGPTDGWGMYPLIQSALSTNGYSYETYTYSGPWNGPVPETGYLTSMPAYSANFDVTVVLTWQSHLNRQLYSDTFQGSLVNNLLNTGRPVVVVALKSPVDILDFPSAATYLATFGTTSGQLQALADVLVGATDPSGINPLPNLP